MLVIIVGGFLIYSAVFVLSRVFTDPDHVVVTFYGTFGELDDGTVAMTIDRVTYHPATNVRGIFSRQSDVVARPEYVQIDGTIALSSRSTTGRVMVGPAMVLTDSDETIERSIRTRGNECLASGWPTMTFQLSDSPGDFTIRIPMRDNPHAGSLLDSIKKGTLPPVTIGGLYPTASDCESLESLEAGTPHTVTLGPLDTDVGAKQDFYPYGEPRFEEPGDSDRELWSEWARGWVPGEF